MGSYGRKVTEGPSPERVEAARARELEMARRIAPEAPFSDFDVIQSGPGRWLFVDRATGQQFRRVESYDLLKTSTPSLLPARTSPASPSTRAASSTSSDGEEWASVPLRSCTTARSSAWRFRRRGGALRFRSTDGWRDLLRHVAAMRDLPGLPPARAVRGFAGQGDARGVACPPPCQHRALWTLGQGQGRPEPTQGESRAREAGAAAACALVKLARAMRHACRGSLGRSALHRGGRPERQHKKKKSSNGVDNFHAAEGQFFWLNHAVYEQAARNWQASRARHRRLDPRRSTASSSTSCCRSSARAASTRSPPTTSSTSSRAARDGVARETIRKTLGAGAMVLDHAGVSPNPARDRSIKLPREEPEEINPPTAEHVEAVYRLLPSKHRLPLLWLDWSGARVSSVDLTLVGDYDEPRRRVRLRAATTKTRRALWVELHPALAEALEATLGAARGPRPGGAAVRRLRRRRAPHVDREGVQGAPASRCSRRTTCATGGSRCCTCGACPGRGSASSSASATSRSPPTRTPTCSSTRPSSTTRSCCEWKTGRRCTYDYGQRAGWFALKGGSSPRCSRESLMTSGHGKTTLSTCRRRSPC